MNEESLFEQAMGQAPAERLAFLDRECAGQPELRQRLEKLLAAQSADPAFLEAPAVDLMTLEAGPPSVAPVATAAGTIIAGRYELLKLLGVGGMGEVWDAMQVEPVKRRVAVKLIKAGMDSKAIVARFEAERQALAMMTHPNIARVLDGGLTADRHPYFVMELVNGLPLTDYCDQHKLTPRQRLELFVPICQAVQHAHQKGVVHRDLKPSNILVATVDGRPIPKVIDFGLAKAVSGKITEETLSTQLGAVVGTLEYMSPEQAGYSGVDVDTRTDIYSLGVILYELLTGLRPIDAKRLKQAAMAEMLRIIQEEEPSRPSTRLSTAEALPSLAAVRQTEPRKLAALLRGELDWVVMKCLEKHRDRRYETANGLARDLERYLADEPVEARPPTAGYRLVKFLRRHRGSVVAASLVTLALVLGIIGTSIGMVRAERLRSEADQAREQETQQRALAQANEAKAMAAAAEEKKAKDLTQQRLAQIEKSNEILSSVFINLDPQRQHGTVAELRNVLSANLKKAAKELEGSAIGDPLAVAAMQHTLGMSLIGLGEAEPAIALFDRAWHTREKHLGVSHRDTLASMNNLALSYQMAGQLGKALPLMEENVRIKQELFGSDHPDTLATLNNLASAYRDDGKLAKAIPLYEETLRLRRVKLGAEHPDTVISICNLGSAYDAAGKSEQALPLLEEALRLIQAKNGPDHPDTLTARNNLALAYRTAGKLDLALPHFEETLKLRQAKLGPDHPQTLTSMGNLALGYRSTGKVDQALQLYEEVLRRRKAKQGPDHPDTLTSMFNLAVAYRLAGKLDLALPLSEEVLTNVRRGSNHYQTLLAMNQLAVCYRQAGKLDQTLPLLEECVQRAKATLGADHSDTLDFLGNLGKVYLETKQTDKGVAVLKEFVAARRRKLAPDGLAIANFLAQVGTDLSNAGQFDTAEPMLRECLTIRAKHQPDDWTTFNSRSVLGGVLLGQKKYTEAEPLLLAGYEGLKQRANDIPIASQPRLAEALDRLIQFGQESGKPEETKKWQAERAKLPAAADKPQAEKK